MSTSSPIGVEIASRENDDNKTREFRESLVGWFRCCLVSVVVGTLVFLEKICKDFSEQFGKKTSN